MTFITRAQWGARPPTSNGNTIGLHPLGVAVHYSAANLGSSPDALCDDKVRGIQNYHIDHNGWADIAYSFLVCPHGNVFEGRGTGRGSAANGTTQANLDYYAVCALGGPKDTPSMLMLASIGDAIGLCRKAGAGAKVIGHRDLFPTACPGIALYAYVKAGRWAKLIVSVKAAVVRVVTPSRSDIRPPIAKPTRVLLAVDGNFGITTRKRLQQWASVIPDGILGFNSWRHIQIRVGTTPTGSPDHNTWVHLQRLIGATQDGDFGPLSIAALQRYLNSH